VIGGGVVGCSVLYHLTKLGWNDVVLLERSELTAGSTWHAAGGVHTLNGDANVAGLQAYTIKLYRELDAESESSCGIHRTGCIYLAVSPNEVDFFRAERTKARALGLALDFIDLAEATRLNPLIETSDYRAAMFDPDDGHVDPSGVTHAFAQVARKAGAEIYRHAAVTRIDRRDGEWELQTSKGTLRSEYIVNAGGLWAREVGLLMGINLPIVPIEHQYIVTNDIPQLAGLGREIPAAVDFDSAGYLRQERNGVLLGTYEQDCRHWAVEGTPPDFGIELLTPDLERIATPLSAVMKRMPALAEAGIKRVVNGGMMFAPDGNPIIGPLPGQPTAFMAAGVMAGFSQGGGVGLAVAHWIVDGEPGMNVFAMDVARFGDFANADYVLKKTRENYQRRFILPCPNEELSAARPLSTDPVYDDLKDEGAVFGSVAGWEVPLWFAGNPRDAHEPPTFRRSNAFDRVREECLAVRERVGIWDTSCYSKIEIAGPRAAEWLDTVVANRVPMSSGSLSLCPILTPRGRVLGDVTVARVAADRFLIFGSPAAESLYVRWLSQYATAVDVRISSRTKNLCGLALTGPFAREVLGRVSTGDISNAGFPFLAVRELTVGSASVLVARISFTGELGYEIYMAPADQRAVYRALIVAGRPLGLRPFGVRALNALRMEKGYGSWGREYTEDYTALEAGLQRLIRLEERQFIGRDAFLAQLDTGAIKKLRLLSIRSDDPDPAGGEPVLHAGRPVGRLTSAAFGYCGGSALGFAYLPAEIDESDRLQVEVLGTQMDAHVLKAPPWDPTGLRLRG
jgi:dimethylglycine dehydrogenase